MASWKEALAKTRARFSASISRIFKKDGGVAEEELEELEARLLEADVPVRLAAELIEALEDTQENENPRDLLRQHLLASLQADASTTWQSGEGPHCILIVGVNGSGKTTTAAKLAHRLKRDGKTPLLGAADTFRAAGSDQLMIWAERVGCDAVGGKTGSDAASVAFEALETARSRKSDVLIVDTAGRMHTRKPLMDELRKVQRTLAKRQPGAPHDVWIVLDATIGQNALTQARQFHETIPLTGVVIAKLDGSAKAGFLFGVARELNLPVRYIGLGEQMDDLVPFDPESFVDAVLGIEEAVGSVDS